MSTHPNPRLAGNRYPAESISTAVRLYFRFPLSLRIAEKMLEARGITVRYETVRLWWLKFGRDIANRLRRGDKWHLDEVVLAFGGTRQYLWRAEGKDGFVLDVLVQSHRDAKTATQQLRKLLKRLGVERKGNDDRQAEKLRHRQAETMPGAEQRQHKGLKNRAENSHQPTRRRERQMKHFKSAHQVQRFLSIHDSIANLFHLRRDNRSAADCRTARAFEAWGDVAGARRDA